MKKSELRKLIKEEVQKMIEAKGAVWSIIHYDDDLDEISTKRFYEFDKKKIENYFNKIAKKLKPGEEVWYQKSDEKVLGDVILVVVNKDGKLKREITRGNRTYYKPFNFFK